MRSSDVEFAPGYSRAARSKLALAIIACVLLATFTPINWFRGWLPRGSSPASSLCEWVECRGKSLPLKAAYFFHGPGVKKFEALLSPFPEEVVIGYPTEEEWERMASKKQKRDTTPASSQFDDFFYDPPAELPLPGPNPFKPPAASRR